MKTVLFALVLLAQPAMAYETLLKDVVDSHQALYQSAGNDNNSIEATYHSSEFADHKDALADAVGLFGLSPKKVRELKDDQATIRALAKCVFYTEGAYGQHIQPEQSLQMAKDLVTDLNNQMILSPDAFIVRSVKTDIVGSGCGVILFSKLNNEFVFLTAVGND